MPKNKRRFADDGWAIWIDGDDTSTVYLNDWLDPKNKSFVDIAVRIRGISLSGDLYVYVPFPISKDDIEDVSLKFNDITILRAIFSAACIIDYKKNPYTSEIAYNGKVIDIIHISAINYEVKPLSSGSLITFDLKSLFSFFDNDEVYLIWRLPHKSMDDVFKPYVDVRNLLIRFRDLITSPVVSEKFGYSIRINEARLLPDEINRIGAFHRQKLNKAVITLSLNEDYEVNDSGCYRISRLEEDLYKEYLPENYNFENVITYQWNQNREYNLQGHFNFYNTISRNFISKMSLILYMVLLIGLSVFGNTVYAVVSHFVDWF